MSEQKEVYSTNAGRMIPADAVCTECDGDGHTWEGDLLIGDCWLCDGLGYFADLLPDEDYEGGVGGDAGLVDYEDKGGRGGGSERVWKKRETRT